MRVDVRKGPILVPTSRQVPWLKSVRRPRYVLDRDYTVIIDGVTYTVPKGYVTDLASIPWFLWALWPPGYGPAAWAAVFHDYCYSHWYRQVTKEFADKAFYEIMVYKKASPTVARLFHFSVSRFGRGGWGYV